MDIAALGPSLWGINRFCRLTGKQIAILESPAFYCILPYSVRTAPPLPIGFGALLASPLCSVMSPPVGAPGGLLYYLKAGVEKEIFPPLILGWRRRVEPSQSGNDRRTGGEI